MRSIILLAIISVAFCSSSNAQNDRKKDDYKVAAIGFYNLENLFDTLDTPDTNDADFLPTGRLNWNTEKYVSKQANMAKVINELATELSPDGVAILGVAEVENSKVLWDLVAQESIKSRNYQVVHYDSPDERGIDCGLLYNPKYFAVAASKAFPVLIYDEKTKERNFTRDILYVSGIFDGEPLHVMVGHWPSRRGGERASSPGRKAAAAVCKHVADSILSADPNAKIVIMGDLNDDPSDASVTQVLNAKGNTKDVKTGGIYNPMYDHFKNGDGTMAYRDAWSLFDQMMVSHPFVHKKSGGWQFFKSVVFRRPWLIQSEGAFRGYPFRTFVGDIFINGYSDHLPVYFFVLKKKDKADKP
jgi:endonuclease/exonuclease/phosphatase family metal-dependent hydrolase